MVNTLMPFIFSSSKGFSKYKYIYVILPWHSGISYVKVNEVNAVSTMLEISLVQNLSRQDTQQIMVTVIINLLMGIHTEFHFHNKLNTVFPE